MRGPNGDSDAAPPDLGLLFATNADGVEAVKIFVNRDSERDAFDDAVHRHHSAVNAVGFDVQDVLAPRRNVLTFYGVGGVGKTALNRMLEARHTGGGPDRASVSWSAMRREFDRSVAVRLDMAGEAGLDLERALLLIRAGVAGLGAPMPAFDLALSRYWEHAHPDGSIEDFLRNDGVLGRLGESLHLSEQIQEGLSEIAQAVGGSSTVVSVASQLAISLVSGMRRKRAHRHAVQGCRRLQALLESEPGVESLSYYPHLLAWDLAQLSSRRNGDFHVTVFVDTFEDVGGESHRTFERLLNRLIWLMPNVLFVICGRNRLDWAEASAGGEIDWHGPVCWPGLAAGATTEPTQHLLGHLSADDSARFLRLRLRRGEEPVIPADVRDRISEESAGYPLYLDLAVNRYLQISGAGQEPKPGDFVGGFPGLVSRMLRDLTVEERRLVRILSLLDAFDTDLASRIAGLPVESIAIRLTQRALVQEDRQAAFPFTIHRLLRRAVREMHGGSDPFTPADWAHYARRAFDELGRRYGHATTGGDRPVANSTLNQAIRLADEFDFELGWCVDAAYTFVEESLWEGSVRPLAGSELATPAAALAQTLLAIMNRRIDGGGAAGPDLGRRMATDLRETARALDEVLRSGMLTGEARDLATYYAAEALRELGRTDEAEHLIQSLAVSDSRIADLATKGLVHILRRAGRFRELHTLITSQQRTALWLQMAGTLSWSQGMLARACADYVASRDLFREAGQFGNSRELEGSLAFVAGLRGGESPDDVSLVASGIAALRDSSNVWARLMADLGAAMLDGDGSFSVHTRISKIIEAGTAAGLTSIQAYGRFAACVNAASGADAAAFERARGDLAAHVGRDFRWLVEVAGFWAEDLDANLVEPADWIDGRSAARERWREVLRGRRLSRREQH
jgi:hypothetical protein